MRGNRAIRDHVGDGKGIHLFEYTEQGIVRYVGEMVCTGYERRRMPDVKGHSRVAIVFELKRIEALQYGKVDEP